MEDGHLLGQILKTMPTTKWEDVIGLEDAKTALLENVILPIKFPQLFKGRRPHHAGILVYGAPGTGKTLLARSLASHIPDATYISINASDLLSKYVGESDKLVQVLFNKAHEDSPCILVIDDLDLICPEENASDRVARVTMEFLVQLGRFWKGDSGVFIVGTTNVPWKIKTDVRRCFSKRIHVPMPDNSPRSQMFEQFMSETAHSLSEDDFRLLGERSEGFTGSDIYCTVRDAQMEPVREVSKATHFKKVSGPSVKDPNIIVDDLMTPCSADDPEAIKMDWKEIQEEKLLLKEIDMETLLYALSKSKPTVTLEDMALINKFKQDFGPESTDP